MNTLIRLEELAVFLLSIYLFALLRLPWWYFPVFLLVPDLGMAGYSLGSRIGAVVYNFVHHRGLALLYYGFGVSLGNPILAFAGLILFAHSTLDRVFGYGLKFSDRFTNTHLGDIGRKSAG